MSAITVVFDLDGTLVDTAPDLVATLNAVIAREGLPPVPFEDARNMVGAGARRMIELAIARAGVTYRGWRHQSDVQRLHRRLCRPYRRPFAAVSGPDRRARPPRRAQDCLFAVCTNKLEGLSRLLLDKLELSARFAAVCGQDTFGVPQTRSGNIAAHNKTGRGQPRPGSAGRAIPQPTSTPPVRPRSR